MQVHTFKTYTIDEHPDKNLVYDWIRGNWYDLGDFAIQEGIESLKCFSHYYNLGLDYSIGIIPDRGEFIHATADDDIAGLSGVRLYKYLVNNYYTVVNEYCPFTGVLYDEVLLDEIRRFIKKPDDRNFQELIDDCTKALLSALHEEGDYIYSDEGIYEHVLFNDYQFTESGAFYA